MSSFTGVLLDVSSTMKASIGDDESLPTWVYSLFAVAFDLVRYDVQRNNRIFISGVGAKNSTETIDLVGTIKRCQAKNEEICVKSFDKPATKSTIKNIFSVLESNGAHTVRQWAEIPVVEQSLSEYHAQLILLKLKTDNEFTTKFVHKDLPLACRSLDTNLAGRACQSMAAKALAPFRKATSQEIHEVLLKALLKGVDDNSVYSVQDVANLFFRYRNENNFRMDMLGVLLKVIEPFIYGRTPLYSALSEASGLFLTSKRTHPDHRKLLLVLSDGFPSDEGNLENTMLQLQKADVTVVCCYIMDYSYVNPQRLYSVAEQKWEDGAKFLFHMSSKIPTDKIPRAIFVKQGWQVDITNNETRLFMYIDNLCNVNDVCQLARNAVHCQDALSDFLVSVSLDIYIDQKKSSTKAPEQVGGTCYAYASATVLHLAMHRILGREHGYPEFEKLRDDMITRHGVKGADTFRVLNEVCPLYRLRCQQVDINGAMKAVSAKRPVVAKFRLTDDEWETFRCFFQRYPTGILRQLHLDITRRLPHTKCGGHAVVLTSYNSECLRLMNSWGENWGDMGFFRVENAAVLGLEFIDVYWTLNDLSEAEKAYYHKHGSEVAEKVMNTFTAFQSATFKCPLCGKDSNVTQFRGTLSTAHCPKCCGRFNASDERGNILALNMYLTSLSR